MKNQKCICTEFDKIGEIKGFNSQVEFERFGRYLDELIKEKSLVQISYSKEKWFWEKKFRCAACNQIWILTEPDFPFKGYWGKNEWQK